MCISKNINNIVYPYKICHVNVNNRDSAAQCDICQSWVHIKYNKLNHIDYKYLEGSNEPWYCLSCCSKIFSFGTLTNKDFIPSISNSLNNEPRVMKVCFHYNLPLIWLLYIQFSNLLQKKLWPNPNFKILQQTQIPGLISYACSLNKNVDDLDHLLKCINKVFDIIAVTETELHNKPLLLLILTWEIMPLGLLLLNLRLLTRSFTLLVTCLINLVLILPFINLTS